LFSIRSAWNTIWIKTHSQASVWLLYQSKPYCVVPREIVRDSYTTRQLDEKIMRLILFIILILVVIAALPTWPYSSGWGYYPSGGLGLILVIILLVVLLR
jgi:hypothetical protein